MNRCDICGKFRKWDDLCYEKCFIDDFPDEHLECNKCSPELFESALQVECDRAINDEIEQSVRSYQNAAI
jgi:hypothetical protein